MQGLLPDEQEGHRLRLLLGLAEAIGEQGYGATTIADIVRRARVSKRTFYEYFHDKEECFLATYEAASTRVRQAVLDAFAAHDGHGWVEQLDAGIDAYVTALESSPALTRSCLVELPAAGARALELRRKVQESFATVLREFVERARARHPEVGTISAPMATAVVGGIDALVLAQVEKGPQHRLANLRETASELMRAVLEKKNELECHG